ncbi:MAG: hypothetical protein JO290_02970 [Sphingomonadaceae bacterium]|nr:hypothetical protein [Sphingomonadaceae bacterium]
MATVSDHSLVELARRSERLEAEARLLRAEAAKSHAERDLAEARRSPFAIDRSTWWVPAAVAAFVIFFMAIGFAIVAVTSAHH